MSSLNHMEKEMKDKCAKELKKVTDPMEKLRLTILKRGSSGIKGLGRYEIMITYSLALTQLARYIFISSFIHPVILPLSIGMYTCLSACRMYMYSEITPYVSWWLLSQRDICDKN